jgi:peptide/nickel transport system permease protein
MGREVARFVIRRFFLAIPTLLLCALGVFCLQRLIPGGPARVIAGMNASPQVLHAINVRLGLDHPFGVQFWHWFTAALQGDFGTSYATRQPVTSIIAQRYVATVELVGFSLVLSLLIGGLVGSWSAIRSERPDGRLMFFATGIGLSLPDFWIGTMAAGIFGLYLGWLPAVGYVSFSQSVTQNLRSVVLPVLTISLVISALITRQLRSALIHTLTSTHVRTARAMGIGTASMYRQDIMRLAIEPVVTLVPMLVAGLVGSAVVVENVFNIPGLGTAIVQSVNNRDYPTLEGITLVLCVTIIVLNLLADVFNAILDPRHRQEAPT